VGGDRHWGVNRRRKGTVNTVAALQSIRAARLDGAPSHITDNLSAHTGADIRRWAKENKAELCFAPTYASRANPVEAHFGLLRQFTLANSHHRSHPAQPQALHRYLRWRHTHARHPDVLTAQRKERARLRSEKGIRWGGRPLDTAA
jgi:transposase